MRSLLIYFAVLSMSACQAKIGPQQIDRQADRKALEELKVVHWRALYANQDADGLDAFLNDDFIFIPGGGKAITKADELEYLRNNKPDMAEDFLFYVDDIIFTGPDSAIVYGKGRSTRTNEASEPCQHTYWSSNTFKRVDGNWRPSFSHVSGAKYE